jgi:competence ComEA-like helix-hairpin-helix protein
MKKTKSAIAQIAMVVMAMSVAVAVYATEPPVSTPVVNINEATEVELSYLPGIGPVTAAHIVRYRQRQLFKQPKHLMRVKGIGRKTFAKIHPYIVVKGETTATKKIKPDQS